MFECASIRLLKSAVQLNCKTFITRKGGRSLFLLKKKVGKIMGQLLNYVILIVGFVLLIKGADYFVDGSSSLAKRFHIPSIVIGLTIVAFGTSAPEAAVSISAAINKSNGIVIGNVVGSNIFNLLMVVGFCAVIKPFTVKKDIMKSEFPQSIYAGLLLLLMSLDTLFNNRANVIDRTEGIILLVFIVIFVINQVSNALKARSEYDGEEYELLPPVKTALFILGGIAAVIIGGDMVVKSASGIARSFGVSDHLIGLTIVAIGTSLPELVTSIIAAKKGESELALGNVIGSNIFNIFFILGMSAAVSPIIIGSQTFYDIAIFLAVSIVAYILTRISMSAKRWHGILYILMYIAFTGYILIR